MLIHYILLIVLFTGCTNSATQTDSKRESSDSTSNSSETFQAFQSSEDKESSDMEVTSSSSSRVISQNTINHSSDQSQPDAQDDYSSNEIMQTESSIEMSSSFEIPNTCINGSFTDPRDSVTYKCINIDTLTWMAENLKYLPQVDSVLVHSGLVSNPKVIPRYWVINYFPIGDSEEEEIANAKATEEFKLYGVLYDKPAVYNGLIKSKHDTTHYQSLCPDGWYLPHEHQIVELFTYLFELHGDYVTGLHLKSKTGWKSISYKDGNGLDTYGFNALPIGRRQYSTGFVEKSETSFFWQTGGMWGFYWDEDVVTRSFGGSGHGAALRCIHHLTVTRKE